jgi:hypothetical protein
MIRKGHKPMTTTDTMTIRPSYVILDANKASGGVSYDREALTERSINGGEGSEKEYRAVKRVDHKTLCKEADALVSKARYMLRRYCASTSIGWVCEAGMLPTLRAEIAAVRTEADDFNGRSRLSRCARRVTIAIVPVRLELDNEAAAAEINRSIVETLQDLRDKIAEGDATKLRTLMVTRGKNLDRLAPGMLRAAIQDALACAETARKELRKAAKENRDPVCDTEAIESAIGLYSDVGSMGDDFGDAGGVALAM